MEAAAKRMESRMRAIAEREHTEVLEYVYDEQQRGADAVHAVKLATLVAERRAAHRELKDAEAGDRLCREDPMLEAFRRSFPVVFRMALEADSARHLDLLRRLARIRKEVEARGMTEAEANVHATRVVLERTAREAREGDVTG